MTTTSADRVGDSGTSQIARRIRILVAAEHSIVRDGLRKLLESESDFEVVGEAGDAEHALGVVTALTPDVLLLDVLIARPHLLDLLDRLRGLETPSRVILLAGDLDRQDIVRALELGVWGVLPKESPTTLLIKSIRSVVAGEHWVARGTVSDLVENLIAAQASAHAARNGFALTRRELEVLELVVTGCANRDIAKQLGISADTVKHHLTSIFNKTGASNRLELALFAIHHGLVASHRAQRA